MNMYLTRIILCTFCLLLTAFKGMARTESDTCRVPRNSTMLFGVGYANQYDTYLSPLEYTGTQVSLMHIGERLLRSKSKHVSFQSLLNIQLHATSPRGIERHMYGGDVHYDAGFYYNWWNVLTPRLTLKAGGQAGVTVGGLYNQRASNNPANAHAAMRIAASLGAQYELPLRRTTLTFRYQADLPVLGAAFSPDYGQSYYELSKYGYCNNICATSLHNAFSLRQLVLMDIRLRRCSLTLGYHADIRQAKLNHLRQHQYAHSFMIGWQKTF